MEQLARWLGDWEATWGHLQQYIDEGGLVMWPLVLATLALWYALGYRFLALRRGCTGDVRRWVESGPLNPLGVLGEALGRARGLVAARCPAQELDPMLEEACYPLRADLSRFRPLIRAIVITAPLAGLLGTVAGMIETFESLGDSALFAATGGVAGGISQALLTTQMGLVVAIPGVIAGRLLDRRQRALEDDLEQLRAVVVDRYIAGEPI